MMDGPEQTEWRFVGVSFNLERPVVIDGVNVCHPKEWHTTGEKAQVVDPLYGARHIFDVVEVNGGGKTVRFAVGEFSNLAYGFYVSDEA